MQKGIKIRIYPNKKQIETLVNTFGCKRFVRNHFLKYAEENNDYSYNNWSKQLTIMKQDEKYAFLKKCDKFALQNALKDLKAAYHNFFVDIKKDKTSRKFVNKPVFASKKSEKQSYRTNFTNNNIEINKKYIKLPKLSKVKCKYNYDLSNIKIVSVTIVKTPANEYYASLIYEKENEVVIKTNKSVGLDLGVRTLITTSDKETYQNPIKLNKIEKKIKRLQRKISKKKLDSNNRKKIRIKKAKIEAHKANIINDAIHKATSKIVKSYDVIYLEDIDINNLVSKQEKRYNKRKLIATSLGKVRRYLEYKSKMYDKQIHYIDRYYPSSQICSCCGNRYDVKDSKIYQCPHCKLEIDRDYNAAINILRYGLVH